MASTKVKQSGMRPLPRPEFVARVLQILAGIKLVLVPVAILIVWLRLYAVWGLTPLAGVALTIAVAVGGILGAMALWGLSLVIIYSYTIAINARLAERRQQEREAPPPHAAEPAATLGGSREMVQLLREIEENTLLADTDKARKRARVAEVRRQQLQTEIRQLIEATKWPEARARIEDFRTEYPDSDEVPTLRKRLEAAIKENQGLDIQTTSEQIRSYMSLGLWEKARQAARQLGEKYPTHAEAQKMDNVVRLEEEVSKKEDRLRLYREIEHLVARKHYRDAKRTAQTLLERYAESAEAASLRGQMDELVRNADIEARREMESQITEFIKQERHREAYEAARMLVAQYPDSPQAAALKPQLEALKERAEETR
jgi:outer membrane protein assembly factor BamD (BamD/ComL family)